tara:strand:- start:267 stop:485 length:219 start_codon:yes stop_codon:yes gene_type:complete
MKQQSLIEWIEKTEQSATLQDYYRALAADIGDLAIEKNINKYIEACVVLQAYVKAGMHPEDAWFETCFDLDI